MRMMKIGLIATAIVAGSMGIAIAQTSTTTTSPSAPSGATKCWDSATRQVRNETPSTRSSSTGSMSGTSSSVSGAVSSSNSTRPPDAAGLPNCRR
ncbi:MAG TPA: hypothetical protein VHU44_00070 [Acidobacteriaceae bacterium]|nr:hypothetical protein [Acidobacteriaceae bacterium]